MISSNICTYTNFWPNSNLLLCQLQELVPSEDDDDLLLELQDLVNTPPTPLLEDSEVTPSDQEDVLTQQVHQAKEFISSIYDDDLETILEDETRATLIQSLKVLLDASTFPDNVRPIISEFHESLLHDTHKFFSADKDIKEVQRLTVLFSDLRDTMKDLITEISSKKEESATMDKEINKLKGELAKLRAKLASKEAKKKRA